MDTLQADIALYPHDLFAPEALRLPFGHYRAIRDLGAVVRLSDPDVHMLARFDDVRDALRASDALASGDGVGFNDLINRPGLPNIIQSDGELHKRLRSKVQRPLLPGQLRQHREGLKGLITACVHSLVDTGPFDAMERIARVLPTTAISELVGLPEEGRAAMLDWAAATFNAIGPMRKGFEADLALLKEAREYLAKLDRTSVQDGSWARTLLDAAVAGKLSEQEARGALSAYVLPSLDTTILAKGHLLRNLAAAPEQWRRLKQDPSLIPGAVLEGVRHSSVIRWFSRVARVDYRVGGQVIPEGARVMLLYGSANRDERCYADPDEFDVTRDARSHLAWGSGPHMCVGMHLARIEMEVMLEALVECCAVLDAGEPEIHANRGLYGFASLPFELRSRGPGSSPRRQASARETCAFQ